MSQRTFMLAMQYNAPKLIAAPEILWSPKSSISKALTVNNNRQVLDSSFTIKVGTVIQSFMIQQLSPDHKLWLSMWLWPRLHKVSMKLHDYQHLKSVNLDKLYLQYETLDRLEISWWSIVIVIQYSRYQHQDRTKETNVSLFLMYTVHFEVLHVRPIWHIRVMLKSIRPSELPDSIP